MRVLGLPDADRRVIAAVYEATGGNALFIEAVVNDLRGRATTASSPVDVVVPAALDQALGATLHRLTAGHREVLTAAAILGDEPTLDDLLGLRPRDAVEGAIAEGEELGIVTRRSHSVRFTHPLYSNLLRAVPDASARRRYHLDVADVLAASDPNGARSLEIARHLIEAGTDADPARRFDAARRARIRPGHCSPGATRRAAMQRRPRPASSSIGPAPRSRASTCGRALPTAATSTTCPRAPTSRSPRTRSGTPTMQVGWPRR